MAYTPCSPLRVRDGVFLIFYSVFLKYAFVLSVSFPSALGMQGDVFQYSQLGQLFCSAYHIYFDFALFILIIFYLSGLFILIIVGAYKLLINT